MRLSAPPKFKILVANLAHGSDPSLNSGGNPVKLRTGFVLQQMVTPDGNVRTNGPTQQPPPVSALDHTAAIQVVAPDYWDPTVTAPGPFFYQEEVRCYDQYPLAAVDFGVGNGSGAGPTAAVATTLADWLNQSVAGVDALAVGDTVYLSALRVDANLPVQGTSDMAVLLGGAVVFTVKDNLGNTLNPPGSLRATCFVPKAVKSQAPPTILY